MIQKEDITTWFKSLQDAICNSLEQADGGAKFIEDNWIRNEGGGGRTRILQEGTIIEKGGVLFSAVHGPVPAFLLESPDRVKKEDLFYATGVSIVIHPKNPMVPIIHMNVRYFEMSNGIWWFGGGIDLTPHYVNKEEATFFHEALKTACDKHDVTFYEKFKNWADDYFFIPHRNETRGIGGVFFDKLTGKDPMSKETLFAFVQEIGNTFAPVYTTLMQKNYKKDYSAQNKQWQLLRRGRYVEFNLVYDKGTRFGLETNGRVESILMSLPANASWLYNYHPSPISEEALTLSFLKKGIHWTK
ncbi:MAG TPA: oxygen-dependent coproporphyrinogen oxidase [Bacteroidia bacterium]|nr:oxygen-dependent coproporphyrinogen oxidase [Bacteroidia bacterium]